MFELAQQHFHEGGGAAYLIAAVLSYLWFSLPFYVIAKRTGTPGAFLAFIPFLNILLMFAIARMSPLWILGLLVPFLNLFILALVWMEIARRRKRDAWVGLLIFVPLVNAFLPFYLAFID